MIQEGDRVILVGSRREYYLRAGPGKFGSDAGEIQLPDLIGKMPGEIIETHLGKKFLIRVPRPPDLFAHGKRSGAPMLPKDIGMVIAYTGMNRKDTVLDAGTGSGVAALYFGGIAGHVDTYEIRPEFAKLAEKNIADAGLETVTVHTGDLLSASGSYDIVHLDMMIGREHVVHAHSLLVPGGFFVSYTPFFEQTFAVMDACSDIFHGGVTCFECMERELTRSNRGTRPSTRVGHSGFLTVARK
ncbi:MAG: protein-L-isoaspartate carboxylmethyltransferase [Methanocalculus sp. MSAO_Arc1]|uniref:protein-L-isoaspartate carboxylmethyltransferase n=1 Tax=Methanocalculus TaxID=71151 RepID=UPI000FF65A80|nr:MULTISPECIES: protein-L-isoaspartate carboxylmethyltransferase [unclassified Methanocalculus]MCP1663112.1 tRNA (adenine57-N1/adenine58-N1)-methyltransferase [Methanocalculus sp. AMF5]RQD81576.1 MAG: protein-L-isoaspartate carboxylmethyltransferase [Methanocalculus sp. MSAO_Arc1]